MSFSAAAGAPGLWLGSGRGTRKALDAEGVSSPFGRDSEQDSKSRRYVSSVSWNLIAFLKFHSLMGF